MTPKYYFVCYEWETRKSQTTTKSQIVIDEHPLQWQIDCNEEYAEELYTVISWQVLTLDEYKRFNELVD